MKTKIMAIILLAGCLSLCGCCTKNIDYRHYLSEWEYINNSSYDLEIHNNHRNLFLPIPAGQTDSAFKIEAVGHPYTLEDVTETPFDAESMTILINGERTVTCPAIGDVANYSVTEVKNSSDPDLLYRFTYTFTDADFE